MIRRSLLLSPWLGLLALSAGCGSMERAADARPLPLYPGADDPQWEADGESAWTASAPLAAGSPAREGALGMPELPTTGAAGNQPGAGARDAAEAGAQAGASSGPDQPSAATSGSPLLIYRADLTLSVFEVEPPQRAIEDVAFELGGFLMQRDGRQITIRVPSQRFRDAMGKVERVGDVLRRSVSAQDVSEEFRDLEVRLKNAEAVRARLEALLAEARDVPEALRVQAELGKVTETIEAFKGRLRFLRDRVTFSTITVWFQLRPSPGAGEPELHRLPFPWLDELGLSTLLDLR